MKGLKVIVRLLLVIGLGYTPIRSIASHEHITFQNISIDQRLPGVSASYVIQDQKGIMWLGVESAGLCKYDGRDFFVFSNNPNDSSSLSNNFINCMEQDNNGTIWVGTENGLNAFNPENETNLRYNASNNMLNSIPHNYINALHKDQMGNLWIATDNGVSKYNPKTKNFTNILNRTSASPEDPIKTTSFYEDSLGNIWFGSTANGLYLIDHQTNFKHSHNEKYLLKVTSHFTFEKEDQDFDNSVMQIAKYDIDHLILGKQDGLVLLNIHTLKAKRYTTTINQALNHSLIDDILRDVNGLLWVGYPNQGLLLIDPASQKQYHFYSEKERNGGLRSNSIRDIYQDQTGLIWIATKFHGLHTYDNRQLMFNKHGYNKFLAKWLDKKFILSIIEDTKHNLWVGTKHKGLFMFNPSKNLAENYTFQDDPRVDLAGNRRIESITEDINGNIWAGTGNGIFRISPDRTYKRYSDIFTRTLEADNAGNVWIGTESDGIYFYEYETDQIKRYDHSSNHHFFSNTKDGTRKIKIIDSLAWFCNDRKGLYKLNLETDILTPFEHDKDDNSTIPSNMIRAVYKDHSGKIWIGSKAGGLSYYDVITGKIIRVAYGNKRSTKTIYSILEDQNHALWMGTHDGLLKVNHQTNDYSLFTNIYGLKGNVFEAEAKTITHDGLMIFGGGEGINVFDPNKVDKVIGSAPMVISSIKLYDETIASGINSLTKLKIPHDTKYLSISFALTEYSNPLGVTYKYKMEGYDKEWIYIGNRNYATFSALPPGLYTFKVQGANSDNEWSSSPLEINIEIDAPLWKNPWVIACLITLLFVLVFLGYWIRLRVITQHQRRLKQQVFERTRDLTKANEQLQETRENLEKIVKKRTKDLEAARKKAIESDELKSAFLANMSHEIRTPLNAIIGLTEMLVSKFTKTKESEKVGSIIKWNAHSLQQLINDIIDISKIEANQIKIYKEPFLLNNSVKNLTEVYANQLETIEKKDQISIQLNLPAEEMMVCSDQMRIEQILKNLINNAIKFTKQGSVEVGYTTTTKNKEPFIRFFVKDTGIGIAQENLHEIFDRFRQLKEVGRYNSSGTGLGLSISYNLCKLLGGMMWVESTLGEGSQFYVEIPLEQVKIPSPKKILTPERQKDKTYDWTDKHILIAEDAEFNFMVLHTILENTKVQLTRVVNGKEAVTAVTNHPDRFDLILMDIKMKEMNGLEATKLIKEIRQSIPVIAQTAFAMDHEAKEILQSGFDGYVSKPIMREPLLEKIDQLMSTQTPTAPIHRTLNADL